MNKNSEFLVALAVSLLPLSSKIKFESEVLPCSLSPIFNSPLSKYIKPLCPSGASKLNS